MDEDDDRFSRERAVERDREGGSLADAFSVPGVYMEGK